MLVLAFDTATPAVTVAVGDEERVLAQRTTVDARRQGELLAVSIREVLAEAGVAGGDLDAIASGAGPGPYTGLRVGLVTARVLGSALGVPAYGFSTLDVIAADAAAAAAGREFLVATDARRRELYWARYSASGARLSGPAVTAPAAGRGGGAEAGPGGGAEGGLPAGLPVAGEGAHAYPDLLGEAIPPRYPSAATAARWCARRLAAGEPLGPPDPLYLRRPDARVPGTPKSVLAAPARASGATASATKSHRPQPIEGPGGPSPSASTAAGAPGPGGAAP